MLTDRSKLSALIIDDEPLAHQVIMHHLKDQVDIEVIGQCYNATSALQILATEQVDLLFLDINMPALSGIEMLRVLAEKPHVIIISAHQEHALEGFELDVTDYLLKPVSKNRLIMALDKVRKRHTPLTAASESKSAIEHIVLKVGRERQKFLLNDIHYVEGYGNYVKVFTGHVSQKNVKMTLANTTLKHLLAELPNEHFVQVHKSFVINKQHVISQSSDQIILSNDVAVKIGKSYKKQLVDLLKC